MTEHEYLQSLISKFKEKIDWHIGLLELLCSCQFLNDDAITEMSLAIQHLARVSENIHLIFGEKIGEGTVIEFPYNIVNELPTSCKVTSVDRPANMVYYDEGLCDTISNLCEQFMEGKAKILQNSP